MKPRLAKCHGLWHCWMQGIKHVGLGFDALQAWEDWADATRLMWRREGRMA